LVLAASFTLGVAGLVIADFSRGVAVATAFIRGEATAPVLTRGVGGFFGAAFSLFSTSRVPALADFEEA